MAPFYFEFNSRYSSVLSARYCDRIMLSQRIFLGQTTYSRSLYLLEITRSLCAKRRHWKCFLFVTTGEILMSLSFIIRWLGDGTSDRP
jgi:hypothetical protein